MRDGEPGPVPGFSVELEAFQGPFDALLSMIANRRLELTEVALAQVTAEFLAYARGLDAAGDLDEASAFLDVASALVEAKSAALLPDDGQGRRDEQSMEALRERDLLFARLLQYRAYREAAGDFRLRLAANAGRHPHPACDDGLAGLLPELVWTIGPGDLARLAAAAFANAPATEVAVHQLHVPLVDLRAQAALVAGRLRALGEGRSTTFAELAADAPGRLEVVARFLAILAFFKQGAVQVRQEGPYAPLHLRWVPGAQAGDALEEKDFA
ncbi:segregation/condensation protein A [Bifidobacterium pullorum subsp. saeculare]|uniref:Segregation and condensation protein A n=1 Tax=Bifidobacterium pullorum subsp. saeculare TaxID=78257 RepID=A0A938WW38_9BIFI|nr:ScpA family protein [Bifidobacterium pullorum]MBM6698986.1 segregation/condensation protein A [Bifidobacterium pullorum subsp. saeculare]